jgi:hypothetical protein
MGGSAKSIIRKRLGPRRDFGRPGYYASGWALCMFMIARLGNNRREAKRIGCVGRERPCVPSGSYSLGQEGTACIAVRFRHSRW